MLDYGAFFHPADGVLEEARLILEFESNRIDVLTADVLHLFRQIWTGDLKALDKMFVGLNMGASEITRSGTFHGRFHSLFEGSMQYLCFIPLSHTLPGIL